MHKGYSAFCGRLLLVFYILPILAQAQANWETDWLHRLADHRTPSKNKFYNTVSDLNSPLTIGVPAGWLALGLITKNNQYSREGFTWAISQLTNMAITHSIKAIANRPRPAAADPTLVALEDLRVHSFPSGHTSSAFALATSVSLHHPKWYVIGPAYAFASLVGYSRCYLGVHYPTDVLAGAVLGAGSSWATDRALRWLRAESKKKKNKPAFTVYN